MANAYVYVRSATLVRQDSHAVAVLARIRLSFPAIFLCAGEILAGVSHPLEARANLLEAAGLAHKCDFEFEGRGESRVCDIVSHVGNDHSRTVTLVEILRHVQAHIKVLGFVNVAVNACAVFHPLVACQSPRGRKTWSVGVKLALHSVRIDDGRVHFALAWVVRLGANGIIAECRVNTVLRPARRAIFVVWPKPMQSEGRRRVVVGITVMTRVPGGLTIAFSVAVLI